MGSPKALLELRGETFLDRLVDLFAGFCAPVVVVLGCDAGRIRTGVKQPERALFVENNDYRLGQLSSMHCGLRMIPETAEGVLFTLVDHPNVQASTIGTLLEPPLAPLALPRFQGRRGHPIFFRKELIAEFLALPVDSQAKSVVDRHAGEARFVDVDDAGILTDVDDPAAYRRLIESA